MNARITDPRPEPRVNTQPACIPHAGVRGRMSARDLSELDAPFALRPPVSAVQEFASIRVIRVKQFPVPLIPRSAFRVPHLKTFLVLLPMFVAFSSPALTAGNPYVSSITNRNVFALKPPPDPASLIPQAPPPNIPPVKLAGITTLLGGKRAILRVTRPARPPAPAGEESLMLAEGAPAESGVQVLEINIAAATVRISNNGTTQTLDLEKDAPKSAPAPAPNPAIPVPGRPGGAIPVPQPAVAPAGGVGAVPRPMRGAGPGMAGTTDNSAGIMGAGPSGIAAPQAPRPLSLEEQEVIIEATRVSDPDVAPILPPTGLGELLDAEQSGTPAAPF
jgi:hypothetical protein